jgi:murein DD-endopeptidase MepM/ murein hydrolase activator NlpD
MRARLLWLVALSVAAPAAHAGGFRLVDGGELPAPRHAPLAPEVEAGLLAEAQRNLRKFGLAPPLPGEKVVTTLAWPVAVRPGIAGDGRTGISNFVDLDGAFPDKLRDYTCGKRTYDTAAGYNHAGIDIFVAPYPWQSMAQGAVEVRAAAAGTLIVRRDGEYDRNCSMNSPDTPNMLVIAHDDGTFGRYLHLKNGSLTDAAVGTRIPAGARLGLVGSSGISTGPHLHFELRGADGSVIEPSSGQCNGLASRWSEQPAYRQPRLNVVGVHSAPPQLFSGECGRAERPNHARWFKPGDTIYVAGYYADQPAAKVSTIVLRRPDGSEQSHFDHAPTASQLGARDAYNASSWLFSTQLPADAAPGRWEASITYEGRTLTQPFAVGGPIYAASGLWYDPAQSGHGFTLDTVDVGGKLHLVAAWFTYVDGAPRWIQGIAPIVGNQATLPAMISKGGRFPPAYDPASVEVEPWGTLAFSFDTADAGHVSWTSSRPGFGNGTMPLSRLSGPADINLDDFDTGMPACTSGTWYDPQQSGHGLLLQVASVGGQRLLLATWYAFHEGKQIWLSGAGPISGDNAEVALVSSTGGRFPPAFNPGDVVHQPWGTARFERIDPQHMRLRWDATAAGFEDGEMLLQRLTSTFTASCQ